MSAHAVRSGPATAAITTTAGTDNSATAPQVRTFRDPNGANAYARPCFVSVPAGFMAAIRVKVNAPASNDFDNDSDDDGPGYWTVAAGATQEVSEGGRIAVQTVSFITQDAGDDLDDVSVVGWLPS